MLNNSAILNYSTKKRPTTSNVPQPKKAKLVKEPVEISEENLERLEKYLNRYSLPEELETSGFQKQLSDHSTTYFPCGFTRDDYLAGLAALISDIGCPHLPLNSQNRKTLEKYLSSIRFNSNGLRGFSLLSSGLLVSRKTDKGYPSSSSGIQMDDSSFWNFNLDILWNNPVLRKFYLELMSSSPESEPKRICYDGFKYYPGGYDSKKTARVKTKIHSDLSEGKEGRIQMVLNDDGEGSKLRLFVIPGTSKEEFRELLSDITGDKKYKTKKNGHMPLTDLPEEIIDILKQKAIAPPSGTLLAFEAGTVHLEEISQAIPGPNGWFKINHQSSTIKNFNHMSSVRIFCGVCPTSLPPKERLILANWMREGFGPAPFIKHPGVVGSEDFARKTTRFNCPREVRLFKDRPELFEKETIKRIESQHLNNEGSTPLSEKDRFKYYLSTGLDMFKDNRENN